MYYRYSLDSSSKKFTCPQCHKVRFVRYVDNTHNSYAPEQYGKCDRANDCNYHNAPPKEVLALFVPIESSKEISAKAVVVIQNRIEHILPKKFIYEQNTTGIYIAAFYITDDKYKCTLNFDGSKQKYFSETGSSIVTKVDLKPKVFESYRVLSATMQIDLQQVAFTEIDTFSEGNNSKGVLNYYNVSDLLNRLNSYRNKTGSKSENPAILKGIYENGTAGEYCKTSAPFLFFDIDVKENENPELLSPNNNAKVFELLKEFCLLVWKSNSQKGIAGLLHFPQLANLSHNDNRQHLEIAKTAYNYLSDYVYSNSGLRLNFDTAQGKFRQIRYLAEQKEQRYINHNSKSLVFEVLPFIPIPVDVLQNTLKGYEQNVFIQNLLSRIPYPIAADEVSKTVELYRIGTVTTGYRAGAVTFPFIDVLGNIRAVQVKQFDEQNHTTATDYLHTLIENKSNWLQEYREQKTIVSCLFGEHLLQKFPTNPVALVEAPKTAIYGALYFGRPELPQQFIWLAVGAKNYLNYERLKVLKGRNVFVFPDLSADGKTFNEWKSKTNSIQEKLPGTNFIYSDLLERLATVEQKQQGLDLADVLTQYDYRKFRKNEVKKSYEQYTQQERILTGLRLFAVQELKELAAEMFQQSEKMSYKEILNYFNSIGLQGNDSTDLLDVMAIRKVVTAIDYPNYVLTQNI